MVEGLNEVFRHNKDMYLSRSEFCTLDNGYNTTGHPEASTPTASHTQIFSARRLSWMLRFCPMKVAQGNQIGWTD